MIDREHSANYRVATLTEQAAHKDAEADVEYTKSEPAEPKPPWQFSYTPELLALKANRPDFLSTDLNRATGLDWQVYQTPAFIYTGPIADATVDQNGYVLNSAASNGFKLVRRQHRHGITPQPAHYLNVRDDAHDVVGIVKGRYRIVQNADAPRFLDHLVESHNARYESAGLLHGGSQVWWLINLSQPISIANDPRERIDIHLLLSSSHDGSLSTSVAVLPVRTASQTVLAWPLPGAAREMKLKLAVANGNDSEQADKVLELAREYATELARFGEQMVRMPFDDQQFAALLERLLPTPKPAQSSGRIRNQRGITMAENAKGVITQIANHNRTLAAIRGTLWGGLNAIQYYADHHTINRNTDDATTDENHFKRLTSGRTLGCQAFTYAVALVDSQPTRVRRG